MSDYYAILNLEPGAGFAAVYDAYTRLKRLHQGNDAVLRRVEEAYAVLSDPQRRAAYNAGRAAGGPAPPGRASDAGRPATEEVAIHPAPAPRPGRPATETIDTSRPASRPARPATETIDTSRPAPRPGRPSTEILDTDQTAPPPRPGRPSTEILDTDQTAPPPRTPRPATNILDVQQTV